MEIVIVDDTTKKLQGVLTPRTVLNRLPHRGTHEMLSHLREMGSTRVATLMERDPKTIHPETPIDEIRSILDSTPHPPPYLLVVDDIGIPLGIIRPVDLIRRLAMHLKNRDG